MMLEDKPLDRSHIVRLHPLNGSERNGLEPEFALSVRRSHMDVRRLASLVGVEVEAERTDAKNRWHDIEPADRASLAQGEFFCRTS